MNGAGCLFWGCIFQRFTSYLVCDTSKSHDGAIKTHSRKPWYQNCLSNNHLVWILSFIVFWRKRILGPQKYDHAMDPDRVCSDFYLRSAFAMRTRMPLSNCLSNGFLDSSSFENPGDRLALCAWCGTSAGLFGTFLLISRFVKRLQRGIRCT